jgi:methylglutaconyl-CoA hydratase
MTTMLRIERDGPVARVWLDRPEVRNAMNGTLIRELATTFGALSSEDGVRVIVLGGNDKAFCAGADLAAMREAANFTWEENHADAAALAEMLWSMYSCPVPVIARIHGDCYAGGLGLASVCDIRVVADAATFSLSEARLGLLPATISPYVIRAMGEQAARRYFVTAERFGAAEARACWFAHEVCAAAAIDEAVEACLRRIGEGLARMGAAVESLKHVKRIVLTDYVEGTKMLDLQKSTEQDATPDRAPAAGAAPVGRRREAV